jgi:predicted Co/Zn/Cd cation transporter (cation efflux family)
MAIGFHEQKEKSLLKFSFFVVGLFVFVAFGFALITQSGAILFDGVYSLVAFFMALPSLFYLKSRNLQAMRPMLTLSYLLF